MKYDLELQTAHHTRRMAFSEDFYRLLARGHGASFKIEEASKIELDEALKLASATLDIAGKPIIDAIWRHNRHCFNIIRHGSDLRNASMMAYLPLNGQGLVALVDGTFDGRHPDIKHVCTARERAEALYLWLILAPRRLTDCLRLIGHLSTIAEGAPLFSRPINANSAHILDRIGFVGASGLFPDATPGLQVLLPIKEETRDIRVEAVTSIDMLLKVFAVRSATYIAEQSAPYDEEFDGNDFCATHLLGTINGDAAGCARIRYFGDFAKFERFAVRHEYRKTALMPRLARACIAHARSKGFKLAYAHARSDLVPLWERFGARLLEDRPPFQFSDVWFREMVLDIDPDLGAVSISDGPMKTIRPEGAWSSAGPLDRSLLRAPCPRRPQSTAVEN